MSRQADVLRAQLLACRAAIDASLAVLGDEGEDVDEIEVTLGCPKCGNSDGDRLEDTSTAAGKRYTCLECGASWTLEVVANG